MRELRQEITRLRERLEKNEELLKEIGVRAEEMKALEKGLERIEEVIEKTPSPKSAR